MVDTIFKLLGGIGLFLLGMVLLTDGLKAFAGEALQRALARFTGTPGKAFASGAVATLLVQSSSATTVTVIGFVSAGLLSFPQAIGVVMGASLGTTGTGWVIAVLGLKISVGFYALPLVGVGAFLKLLGKGRWRNLGPAVAGFGLIFIGIETLQDAMRGLTGVFDPASLPSTGLLAHALAMLLGVILTVLMQSSTAAVATTLTALHTGTISFEQAASIVIGAAVGTTVTGALAAIGGNTPARRTAAAHVLFNLASGLIALLLLPLFLRLIAAIQRAIDLEPGAMSLAAFHTLFIAVGCAVFLPLTTRFARAIERMLPDRDPPLTRHLDDTLLQAPPAAVDAVRNTLREIAGECFVDLRRRLDRAGPQAVSVSLGAAMARVESFFPRIPTPGDDPPLSKRRVAVMHAIDHLSRLLSHVPPTRVVADLLTDPQVSDARALTAELLDAAGRSVAAPDEPVHAAQVESHAARLVELRRAQRPKLLEQTAHGRIDPDRALALLDSVRWLDRVGYHAWRITHYLAGGQDDHALLDPTRPFDA